MAVDIFERKNLNLAERLVPYIPDNLIRHFIIAYVHQPLGQSCDKGTYPDLKHDPEHSREIHISFGNNIVNGISRKLWYIERKCHRNCCQQNGKHQEYPVSSQAAYDFSQGFRLSCLFLFIIHWMPPPLSGTVSNRSPDKRDRSSEVRHAFRCLPSPRHPGQ